MIKILSFLLISVHALHKVPAPTIHPNKEQAVHDDSVGYDWVKHIRTGQAFQAILKQEVGTLASGEVYQVSYGKEGFETFGYNLYYGYDISATYNNANPKKKEISLWGAVFKFDESGRLFYKGDEMGVIVL